MGKTLVKQPLPVSGVRQISPFLLLHHFGPTKVEPGTDPLDVGPHPHRGFEPVTFLFSGGIHHKDSLGNQGILSSGDVQWMTAGRGIIHSERASKDFLDHGGTMEGIQLWVNLRKEDKMVPAGYQDIKSKDIPLIEKDDDKIKLKLVAGEFDGQKGIAKTFTPIVAIIADFKTSGNLFLDIAREHNAAIYVVNGKIKLAKGHEVPAEHLAQLGQQGEGIDIEALEDSRLLILSGQPINEPLAQYGPFVMNTQTEILEAMRDYQKGKMGVYTES